MNPVLMKLRLELCHIMFRFSFVPVKKKNGNNDNNDGANYL